MTIQDSFSRGESWKNINIFWTSNNVTETSILPYKSCDLKYAEERYKSKIHVPFGRIHFFLCTFAESILYCRFYSQRLNCIIIVWLHEEIKCSNSYLTLNVNQLRLKALYLQVLKPFHRSSSTPHTINWGSGFVLDIGHILIVSLMRIHLDFCSTRIQIRHDLKL